MNVVGKVSSLIRQGMYSVATPFHPFGGAVDIIVVKQQDGSFKSTPWYVRFGKFQGVLKGAEKIVRIEVNGVEADFYMFLDNSGEAYFVSEADCGEVDVKGSKPSDSLEGGSHPVSNDCDLGKNDNDRIEDNDFINNGEVEVRDERLTLGMDRLDRTESSGHIFYDFQDELSSLEFPEYDSDPNNDLDSADHGLEMEDSNSEVVLVSVDGHILMAPISSSERNDEHAQESRALFHLGREDSNKEEITSNSDCFSSVDKSPHNDSTGSVHEEENSENLLSDHQLETSEGDDVHTCCAELVRDSTDKDESMCIGTSTERKCTGLQREEVFQSCLEFSELARQSVDEDEEGNKGPKAVEDPPKNSPESFIRNDERGAEEHETLRIENELSSHDSGSLPELHTGAATSDRNDTGVHMLCSNSLRIRFDRSVRVIEQSCGSSSSEEVFVDSVSVSPSKQVVISPTVSTTTTESPRMQIVRTNVPTSDQIASLNLKEGQNIVNFIFSTRVLGTQKVEAHIYVWKWNTRIVISDVDGTITKSDVLGQFMPLFGRDWTHSGIARLFSAVKENGYQLLFLSARAIVQAYLTKSFLFNLKQDGKSLPIGPVVISPDGLFPSLYREVIRRAPHEFKIACLEDIKALFPQDYNPFYAGFGNRDTDELSYRKIGIPKGKIFIINPKGEVAINHRIDVKSYTSLHTLVNDMFPPTSLVEQEDYNSWNYWKMPLPDIDGL